MTIVGEAPGGYEVEEGAPFVGPSGKELDIGLDQGGLQREDCWITNVLLCQPPDDFEDYVAACKHQGKESPVDCCRLRLDREIEEAGTKVVLAVGGQALKALCQRYNISYGKGLDSTSTIKSATILNQHGAPIEIKNSVTVCGPGRDDQWSGPILCSSLHPAFAMREARHYKFVIRNDIARAALIANRGHVLQQPYENHVFVEDWDCDDVIGELERLISMDTGLFAQAKLVACDIETDSKWTDQAKIRCIGFAANVPHEVAVCVPFRWRDGRDYWARASQEVHAKALVMKLLQSKQIVYHNGAYDTDVMLRHGFLTEELRHRPWIDTMIMDRDTDANDLPHGLGAVARRYFELRMWKEDADAKDAGGVADDLSLHEYNLLDVIWTLRLAPKLAERIRINGTTKSFQIDTARAPIYREMGALGLWINERIRGELAIQVREIIELKEAAFREASGRDKLNLRSPPQVGKWLFKDLGLRPQKNTKGKDFKEGDKESTGVPSLLALIQAGVEPSVETAINRLIEYKAAEKLRSSYIDRLPVRFWDDFSYVGHEEKIEWKGEEVLPDRPTLSHLAVLWKLTRTPSGRSSSSPNVQNVPSAAYGGIKLKRMYVAPPGHVITGADLEQVEARIYLALSGDKVDGVALTKGYDLHTLTAAQLFTGEREPEHPRVLAEYKKINSLVKSKDQKQKEQGKFLRNVAKTVRYGECIIEGTPVLTEQDGEVPIEKVAKWHKVWDGEEYVAHDGVICRGIQEVITHDEVTATPDHEVWLETGRVASLSDAAAGNARLARSGEGRNPLRFLGDQHSGLAREGTAQGLGGLHELWLRASLLCWQLAARQIEGMQLLLSQGHRHALLASRAHELHGAALQQSEPFLLAPLWGSRDRVPVLFSSGGCFLDPRESRPTEASTARSDRQQWALRARQSSLGHEIAEYAQHPAYAIAERLGIQAGGVALREGGHREEDQEGHDPRRDHQGSLGVRGSATGRKAGWGAKTARVYDILNAGPRHRFTAAGRLVSNCYGAEEGKLFDIFQVARDKVTLERLFPAVTREDAEKWHRAWHKAHPETHQWQSECFAFERQHGFMYSLLHGRRRFFPGGPNKRNAVPNMLIQSTAHAIVDEAILKIAKLIPFRKWSPYSGLILDIHDDIKACVPERRAEEAEQIIFENFRWAYNGVDFPCAKPKSTWDLAGQD